MPGVDGELRCAAPDEESNAEDDEQGGSDDGHGDQDMQRTDAGMLQRRPLNCRVFGAYLAHQILAEADLDADTACLSGLCSTASVWPQSKPPDLAARNTATNTCRPILFSPPRDCRGAIFVRQGDTRMRGSLVRLRLTDSRQAFAAEAG